MITESIVKESRASMMAYRHYRLHINTILPKRAMASPSMYYLLMASARFQTEWGRIYLKTLNTVIIGIGKGSVRNLYIYLRKTGKARMDIVGGKYPWTLCDELMKLMFECAEIHAKEIRQIADPDSIGYQKIMANRKLKEYRKESKQRRQ